VLDGRGIFVQYPAAARNSSTIQMVRRRRGVNSDSYATDNGALYTGVKRTESEADHSAPPSAEVMKEWTYISTHPYVLISCTGSNSPLLVIQHGLVFVMGSVHVYCEAQTEFLGFL
jgi:hypothetical protein